MKKELRSSDTLREEKGKTLDAK
jgi:hypothetical protein